MVASSVLVGFNPGSEAEPVGGTLHTDSDQLDVPPADDTAAGGDSGAPSVLNKLQKWANYEAMGQPVPPTRFIPMKTPMSNEILDNWSLAAAPRHALTVSRLLAAQAAAGRTVGLIIDLANHDCLYSDDVPPSLEYEHVQLVAKVLPARAAIDEVERIARSFWGEHPDQYIAIHCAYGFNRTGFVVCSYLCQACGLSVEQALESFAAARPPGVKHEKFVRELYARYGDSGAASLADTPEGSLLGASPPAPAAVDGLAAEAQWLVQHGAAAANGCGAACSPAEPAAEPPRHSPQRRQPLSPARLHQQSPQQQREAEETGEDAHFEDAAAMVRLGSHQRSLSQRSSGGVDGGPGSPSPAAASRPGSNSGSRNPSRHGSGQAEPPCAEGGEGPEGGEDAALATAAGVGFEASRKLLQRKVSRGGGGLSQALAGGSPCHAAGGSPGSATSGAPDGGSPVSCGPTAASSMSDFASAAAQLEGANSMRRATSLGLAKALCEDFLQNNGTPSSVAPIAAAAAAEAQRQAAITPAAGDAAALDDPEARFLRQQQQQQQQQGCVADGGLLGSRSSPFDADAEAELGARGSGWYCSGPACLSSSPSLGVPLGSSPCRRGGIPLPRVRSGACHSAHQQPSLQQPHAQPGTPLTPASSGATPLSSQQRQSGFPRSVSIDSENPSLGFNTREALHHLRGGAPPGAASNVRGPQALADLFREDSQGELAALDVEQHLQALVLGGGADSPAAPLALPPALGAAVAEAAARHAAGGGSALNAGGGPRRAAAADPAKCCVM